MRFYYYVFDNGNFRKASRKDFLYWVKEFARFTFNDIGNPTYKSDYSDIINAYNPQGYLIAFKEKVS